MAARGDACLRTYRIAAIPGDGIGSEVIAAGVEALTACAKRDNGFTLGLPDGLWTPSGGVNQSGVAYQQVQNWLVGATQSGSCSASGTIWSCSYTRSGGYQALATWDTSQSCSNGTCSTKPQPAASQYLHYRDLAGNTFSIANGTVPVGAQPILLENQ